MATGVTNFPGSLDTAVTLLSQVNDCETLLNASITDSATSLSLVDGSLFPSAGIARIENEYIKWDSKADANTLSSLTRGAYGSVAASHSSAVDVKMTLMAGYHNVLTDAIIAIETKIGTGADTATSNDVFVGTGAGTSGWAKIVNANIDASAAIAISKLNITGTPDGTKFLRDDGSWQAASGTGITALTGDVTASGSGSVAATIANDAVTYAKMQNVSAASKLLGRGDSGSGDVQEITLGSGLSMSGTTISATGGSGTVASATADQVAVYTGSTTVDGDTDFTFTHSTSAKLLTITSPSSTALIRVTPVSSGNSGFSNTTSAHPGTGGGLFLPFVAGSQSDGPGIWWTNGNYSGLAGIWLSGGFNLQGWNSSNSSLKIRKGTGTSSNGGVIFNLNPDSGYAELNPFGTSAGETTAIRFMELAANGSNYFAIKAADNISTTRTLVLPNDDPSAGDFLKVTSFSGGVIVTEWST